MFDFNVGRLTRSLDVNGAAFFCGDDGRFSMVLGEVFSRNSAITQYCAIAIRQYSNKTILQYCYIDSDLIYSILVQPVNRTKKPKLLRISVYVMFGVKDKLIC